MVKLGLRGRVLGLRGHMCTISVYITRVMIPVMNPSRRKSVRPA